MNWHELTVKCLRCQRQQELSLTLPSLLLYDPRQNPDDEPAGSARNDDASPTTSATTRSFDHPLQLPAFHTRKPLLPVDQIYWIQAAIEGHGVALGRVALVLPMLQDGRLVALGDTRLGNSDYAYWLIDESSSLRTQVQVFRDWIIKEVELGALELESMNTLLS